MPMNAPTDPVAPNIAAATDTPLPASDRPHGPDSAEERAARPRLVIVAAVARNGTIGHDNDLVWRIPEDLAHFRRVTLGHPVLMGRRTWDGLPPRFRPLPGRRNLVLTRQAGWQATGAEAVHTLDEAIARCQGSEKLFVIGGAQVYGQALSRAQRLELTEIQEDFQGDAHFPDAWREGFTELSRRRVHTAAPNGFDIDFVTFARRA